MRAGAGRGVTKPENHPQSQPRCPPLPPIDPRLVLAKKLHGDQTLGIDDICRTLKISRSTYCRYVAK